MKFIITEKGLETSLVPARNGFLSFDVEVATLINIESAVLLHEIRRADYQLNYDKNIHIVDEEHIEKIMQQLNLIFSIETQKKSLKKLLKNSYLLKFK